MTNERRGFSRGKESQQGDSNPRLLDSKSDVPQNIPNRFKIKFLSKMSCCCIKMEKIEEKMLTKLLLEDIMSQRSI